MDISDTCDNDTTHASCTETAVPLHSALIFAFAIGLTAAVSICLNIAHFNTIRCFQDAPMPSKVIFKVHAVCDIAQAVNFILMVPLIANESWDEGKLYCSACGWALGLLANTRGVLYLLQHLDRLLSVVRPFRYTAFMTNAKIWVCTLLTILISEMLLLSNPKRIKTFQIPVGICYIDIDLSFNQLGGFAFLVLGVLLPGVLFICIYIRLLIITYKHAQKIHAQELAGAPRPGGQGIFMKMRSIKRALGITAVTVGWFAFTSIPLSICHVLNAGNLPLNYAVEMFAWWMFLCQTYGNVICLMFKESYRQSLMKEVKSVISAFQCKRAN